MQQFKQNLEKLPSVDHIQSLTLYDEEQSLPVTTIENKPGKSASVKIYHYLDSQFGAISVAAAEKGLALYAEYVQEAKEQVGSHPNIDLLFDIITRDRCLTVKTLKTD